MSVPEQYTYNPYTSADFSPSHDYLLGPVLDILEGNAPSSVIELGCGNGSVANVLSKKYSVVALDASHSGIEIAKTNFPNVRTAELVKPERRSACPLQSSPVSPPRAYGLGSSDGRAPSLARR